MGLGSEPAVWALHLQAQEGGQSNAWRQQNVLELVRARLNPERPLALRSLGFLICKLRRKLWAQAWHLGSLVIVWASDAPEWARKP